MLSFILGRHILRTHLPAFLVKMLVCLACPKQANNITTTHAEEAHHHHAAGLGKSGAVLGPSREHIKSFTAQLKDIVMKFSTGAYRHCRPCTTAGLRRAGTDDDNHTLYAEDDDKSSILITSNSEDQASSDHGLHHNLIHKYTDSMPHDFGNNSWPSSSSRYDLLPVGRTKRRKKKSSLSKSSLSLKQLPSHPESCDAIEELLNAHFRREERILAEEQSIISRDDDQENRADHELLEEANLVSRNRERHIEEHNMDDDDVHVKRSKRHVKVESAAGHGEEWVAQVEPGVMITFVALPDGSNHLKRIRFSRELFSKWQAQLWWAENSEMVRELYSVSKTEALFKSCSSARSSSSRTSAATSSHYQHTLQNTPEVQSRGGSFQASPSNTPTIISMSTKNKTHPSPTPCSPQIAQILLPKSNPLEGLSREMMDHHDNPLYDNPEFELCYNEGVKDALALPSELWVSALEEHSQHSHEDNDILLDDASSSPCELVHELKRVRFIK